MRKTLIGSTFVIALSMLFVSSASAATGYTFFGDADYSDPGNGSLRAVETMSDADPGHGGIEFDIAEGTTLADLGELSTDYNVTDDNCAAGSPRFQIEVSNGVDSGNIFVYLGPEPNYTPCDTDMWINSGNLLEGTNMIDTSQLDGGMFYDPYETALTKYGTYEVMSVSLVSDGGWNAVASGDDGEQTVWFDNTMVGETLYTYELVMNTPTTKDQCKHGGWESLENEDGMPFRNQGQCMQYVNRSTPNHN